MNKMTVRAWLAVTITAIGGMQAIQPSIAAGKIQVTALTPAGDESPFWSLVSRFMRAVAKDLDIDLKIVVSKENTISLKRDSMNIVTATPKPDVILTPYWGEATRSIFPLAEQHGIKMFLFNSDVFPEHLADVGQARGKYADWIGHMSPNDKQAGYTLGKILIESAKKAGKISTDGKVHLFGFSGHDYSTASQLRSAGLDQYIAEFGNAILHEMVFAHWKTDLAEKMAPELYGKYPQTTVVWAASDSMAIGSISALKATGKVPGKDFFTGGIDWSQSGVESVAAGEMTATIGGHFLEGGWALVLIHDYINGIDFAGELGTKIPTPMQAITAENVRDYQLKMKPENWDAIDFKQFSKKHNRTLKKYDFSLEALLSHL